MGETSRKQSGSRCSGEECFGIADEVQKIEARGFAGAGLRGTNVEIGSGAEDVFKASTRSPQSEDGELVVITNQILAEIRGDCIKDFCAMCFRMAISCGFQVFHGFLSSNWQIARHGGSSTIGQIAIGSQLKPTCLLR